MSKKLYKSNTNKMLEGVCGGIAEYFGIDPTIVRLAWVVFCALGGSGILAYIIAAIIIPSAPLDEASARTNQNRAPLSGKSAGSGACFTLQRYSLS